MILKCVKTGINGEGIAYKDKKPVFIEGFFPGEEAEVTITAEHETYCYGTAEKLLHESSERRKPECEFQEKCGGCPLMPLKYGAQLKYKKRLLEESLYKYGNVRREFIRDVRTAEKITGYRNQCKLPVGTADGRPVTGMYKVRSNHFVEIGSCPIHEPLIESTRKQVLKLAAKHRIGAYDQKEGKGLRYLIIRVMDEQVQCVLVTGRDALPQAFIDDVMKVRHMCSLFQSVNTQKNSPEIFGSKLKKLAGADTVSAAVCGIKLQLSPQSFFQLNTKAAEGLYELAVSKIDACDVLAEAYCGIGAMSLLAAKKAKRVYGIESVSDAVINAAQNAAANGIGNCEFICADAAEGLRQLASEEKIDTLLLDPPRSGLDDNMVRTILKVLPSKIIYVSCNPATLAKNLKELKKEYRLVTVIPYDMFPNTPHIESVSVLIRSGFSDVKRRRKKKN